MSVRGLRGSADIDVQGGAEARAAVGEGDWDVGHWNVERGSGGAVERWDFRLHGSG